VTATDTVHFTDPQGQKQQRAVRSLETWKKAGSRWMLVTNQVL
jgi:hypothetical protein